MLKTLRNSLFALLAAMPAVAAADGADQVLLFIVDILREEATLLVPNDFVRQVAERSFGVTVTGDSVVLPGVITPAASAASIMARPMRSLTLDSGLKNSHLPTRSAFTPNSLDKRRIRTSGVAPIVSRMLS